jgi:hypothetical protein
MLTTALKRADDHPWFCLMGSIGDSDDPAVDGIPQPLTTFPIANRAEQTIRTGGYLYCFANDAKLKIGESDLFYRNNRESVALTITRFD